MPSYLDVLGERVCYYFPQVLVIQRPVLVELEFVDSLGIFIVFRSFDTCFGVGSFLKATVSCSFLFGGSW